MTTLNELTEQGTVVSSDQVPLFSTVNGQPRRASVKAISDFMNTQQNGKVNRTGDTMTGPLNVPEGATGTQATQAQEVLSANIANYASLRAYAGGAKAAYITGYLISAAPNGIAGLFTRDDADTTSADNGGTIIVAANGRRWKRQFAGSVHVKWFGTVGDGVADDRPNINTAAAAVPDGGALEFDGGKIYSIGAQITSEKAARHIGNGCTIRPTAAAMSASGIGFALGKQIADYAAITPFSTVQNSSRFTVPAGVAVARGDVVLFRSNTVYLPGGGAGDYKHGQWAVIESVSGGIAYTSSPFYAAFQVDRITVVKGYAQLLIEGFNFDLSAHPNSTVFYTALYAKGSNIKCSQIRINGNGNDYAGVGIFVEGENALIENCAAGDLLNVQGLPLPGRVGYGVKADANNTLVINSSLVNCKHAFTSSAREFVVRGLAIKDSLISEDKDRSSGDYTGSIDVHAGVSDALIAEGNRIFCNGSAFFVRNGKAKLSKNIVVQVATTAPILNVGEMAVTSISFERNTVEMFAGAKLLALNTVDMSNVKVRKNKITGGSLVSEANASKNIDNLRIENNDHTESEHGVHLMMTNSASVTMRRVKVVRNNITLATGAGASIGVLLATSTASGRLGVFTQCEVEDNTVDASANTGTAYCMQYKDAVFQSLSVRRNKFYRGGGASGFRGMQVSGANVTNFALEGNESDSVIAISSGGVNCTLTNWQITNNKAARIALAENTAGFYLAYVNCAARGNTLVESATETLIAFAAQAGSGGWAASTNFPIDGNILVSPSTISISADTNSTGNKLVVSNNDMGGRFNDASAAFYSVPRGNILRSSQQNWKDGTVATIGGELTKTAAPTAGTWSVLDRVRNSVPTVGQPKAWVCTAAGAPGTWISEGNL